MCVCVGARACVRVTSRNGGGVAVGKDKGRTGEREEGDTEGDTEMHDLGNVIFKHNFSSYTIAIFITGNL